MDSNAYTKIMTLVLLIIMLLVGCSTGQPVVYRSALDQARIDCTRDLYPIVRPHVATWPTKDANRYFRSVVSQCIAMEMTQPMPPPALTIGSTMLYGFGMGYLGGPPFGAPNAIGPYGTLGPTWQSFNSFIQPNTHQQFDNLLMTH